MNKQNVADTGIEHDYNPDPVNEITILKLGISGTTVFAVSSVALFISLIVVYLMQK
jgi:hypothetical protein